MATTNENINFKGNRAAIVGPALKTGVKLPQFKLTGTDMADLTNQSFSGKVLVISVIPSIDTPVCALQTKRFNKEASELSDNAVILTVSMDLPFAQKRWCGAEGIDRVVTASDYKYRTFGETFGVLLKDLGLLTRAVFIADASGNVTYVDYVSDVGQEPDYEAALGQIRKLL